MFQPGGISPGFFRHGDLDRVCIHLRERQLDEPLIHVELVRHRSEAQQRHPVDLPSRRHLPIERDVDQDRRVVVCVFRRHLDLGSRSPELVRRAEELYLGMIHQLSTLAVSRREHSTIGNQDRGGMVRALVNLLPELEPVPGPRPPQRRRARRVEGAVPLFAGLVATSGRSSSRATVGGRTAVDCIVALIEGEEPALCSRQ